LEHGGRWRLLPLHCDAYRDHCLAYPTVDGVVGTLAIVGLREGLDDVKYATALRLAIGRAEREGVSVLSENTTKAL